MTDHPPLAPPPAPQLVRAKPPQPPLDTEVRTHRHVQVQGGGTYLSRSPTTPIGH